MFFNSSLKCRSGFRYLGDDLGRFCLCDFVFSTFLVAKRRLSAAETKVVGGGLHCVYFGDGKGMSVFLFFSDLIGKVSSDCGKQSAECRVR